MLRDHFVAKQKYGSRPCLEIRTGNEIKSESVLIGMLCVMCAMTQGNMAAIQSVSYFLSERSVSITTADMAWDHLDFPFGLFL